MCQTIHTYFPRHFATYLLHFFCYMFTFHLHTCSYIWEATSCYTFAHVYTLLKTISCRTFIGKAIFVLLIHILERQFYIICSYWEAFSCHFQHICTFCKAFSYLFNIHMYMVNNIFNYLGTRKTWCSPNQVLALRGNLTSMLSLSCLLAFQKSKAWVPRPKSYFGIYLNFRKLSPHLKNGNHTCTNPIYKQHLQTYAQTPLRHFTEHLVGALLGTNNKGMGATWLAPSSQNTT